MQKIDIEQGSTEWLKLRWGNVTGSTLPKVMGNEKSKNTFKWELIAQRMTEMQASVFSSPAVEHGHEVEPEARSKAIEHTGIDFIETGLLVCDQYPHFSISPDAIWEDNGTIKGGLEIKCPTSATHVKYIAEDWLPDLYLWQVASPFIMSDDVEFWDFVSYDNRNYQRPLFFKRIEKEQPFEIAKTYHNNGNVTTQTICIAESLPIWREELKQFLKSVTECHVKLSF